MRTAEEIQQRIDYLWSEVRATEDGLEIMLMRREITALVWVLSRKEEDTKNA